MTRRAMRVFGALVIVTSAAAGGRVLVSGPAGEWSGTYTTSEAGGALALRIDSAAHGWTVKVRATSAYAPDPQFIDATGVRVSGDSLTFGVTWGAPVVWRGRVRGDSAAGVITADHWSGSWTVARKK